MGIILPTIRTSQPQQVVTVDRSNPDADGLTLFINGATPFFNSANGKKLVITGGGSGFSRRATPHGISLYTPNGGWANVTLNEDWSTSGNTVLFFGIINSIDNPWGGLFCKEAGPAANQFAAGRINTTNEFYGGTNGIVIPVSGSSISANSGKKVALSFAHLPGGGNVWHYVDGVYVGEAIGTGALTAGSGVLGLGRESGSSATYDSDIDWIAVLRFNRLVDGDKLKRIVANPWALLAKKSNVIFFPVAGGGVSGTSSTTNANDASSASGSTTVTGSSATTNANDTSAASGAVGNDITGTIATTNANDASSASGTTSIIGSIAATNGNDASSSTGTTTVTGTAATTNANDTSAASGIAGAVTGTIAYTNENDTSSGIGTAGDSITPIGGDDAPHGIYYQDQKKRKITRKPLDQLMDEAVAEYYEEIKQTAPKAVQRKAAKIVRPYAEDKLKIPEKVDWEDLSHDIARVRQLINLYAKEVAEKQRLEWMNQDDENVLMLAHEHDKAVIVEYLNQFYS